MDDTIRETSSRDGRAVPSGLSVVQQSEHRVQKLLPRCRQRQRYDSPDRGAARSIYANTNQVSPVASPRVSGTYE